MSIDNDVARRESARPTPADAPFDAEADIVVVGGGGGGLPAALFSRWLGNEVVLLEKAPSWAALPARRRSGTGCRTTSQCASGDLDDESGCLRYMARLSRPQSYDPDHPTFGMTEWEFELCRGI